MATEYRPKIELSLSYVDKVQEMLAVALLVAHVILVALNFAGLPESVPIHINYRDEIDGWGKKGTIWLLPLIAMFIYGLMTVLNRRPDKFNYPYRIKPENAEWEYLRATRVIRWMKLSIMGLLLMLTWRLIAEVRPEIGYAGPWLTWVALAGVLFAPLWYLVKSGK
ncbi:MAG: DUF1648 domain-containing protein [Saprospiraceae bacterium]|nr:DUF1648 domain-containing protein [Saprospiraceae bacterium]